MSTLPQDPKYLIKYYSEYTYEVYFFFTSPTLAVRFFTTNATWEAFEGFWGFVVVVVKYEITLKSLDF